MKFAVAVTLAASVAYASATDYYWRHDSEWATDDNWNGGTAPTAKKIAAFGVYNTNGDVEECGNMDALIRVPAKAIQEMGGLLMAPGVEISLGVDAEIVINSVNDDDVVQWKCKSDQEKDFRCGANWGDKENNDVAGIPCMDDGIYFSAASFNVNNEGVPLVKQVTIAGETFSESRDIEGISDTYPGIARSFIAESTFSSEKVNLAAADLACFNSCPWLDEITSVADKYAANHTQLQKRQEFIATALEAIGEDYEANPSEQVRKSEQALAFGRSTLYVYLGDGNSADPSVKIERDVYGDDDTDFADQADTFCTKVEDSTYNHFLLQMSGGECLNPDARKEFSFHPVRCVPLANFAGDKVNACVDGENVNGDYEGDACPSTNSVVCPDPAHTNVATRYASTSPAFLDNTCGDFNEDIGLWYSASAGEQAKITANCCEPNEKVLVVACGFETNDMQDSMKVNVFGKSLVQVTKEILHGASRGSRKSSDGECKTAYIAETVEGQYLPIDLFNAEGSFLADGSNEDIDTSVAVHALGTASMAAALADYEIASKSPEEIAKFDAQFHIKKFMGVLPADRRRKSFKDIKDDIQDKLRDELPFGNSLVIGDVVLGSTAKDYDGDAQILLKGVRVTWFEADNLATISTKDIEPYVANVMLGYGMIAQEYALKLEEFKFLTTSTTTTITRTTTVSTTTMTEEAEASGIPEFVKDAKTGAIICRGGGGGCDEDKQLQTVESAMADIKEVFDAEAAGLAKLIADADTKLEQFADDKAVKSATYVNMKKALDMCDKTGLDKVNTIAYPDGCEDEKAAFDAAAQDFNTFVGDATDGYAQKVETIFTKKGDDMAALASLQGDYNEDLLKLLDFDAALHNNDESPATYKTPEELKDMQASFSTVTDELEALATAVEANMRDLASASKDSISEQSASDAELKSEETKLQKAYDDCVEEEESRLEDVPAPVLGQSGPYYELELALKQSAMDATCGCFKGDLLNTQAMLAGNSNKYAALKAATDDALSTAEANIEIMEEFEDTGKAALMSAITARVEEDEALPLIPIIAGAGGALVLIIIVVVLMSGGGGGGSQQGGYGGNGGWGEGQGGSSVVAFENPVYAGEEEGNYDDGYGQEDDGADDGGGLYDEPEMFSEGGNDGGGAGGGYLDVAPDDEGEDEEEDDDEDEDEEEEDDEDEEEEAAEEEDDEEEEEDDDEEEEDDDEDDDDEDDDSDDDDDE